MRKTTKKTIALLLTVIMLLSIGIPMVSAESTFVNPSNAADGSIIWEVDFNDSARYDYTDVNRTVADTTTIVPSADGRSIKVSYNNTGDAYNFSFGGIIDGIDMSATSEYTIEFSLMRTNPGRANYIYTNSGYADGFAFTNSSASGSNANYYRDWTNFSVSPATSATTYDGKEYNEYTYRLELESATKKSRLYVLSNDEAWVKVAEDATQQSGELYLVLGALANGNSSEDVIFSDVKIYKGLTASKTYEPDENIFVNPSEALNGERIWRVDFNQTARYNFASVKRTVADTTTIVPSADGRSIKVSYNNTGDAYNFSFGGIIDGIDMSATSEYTIEFSLMRTNPGRANYIYTNSGYADGFAFTNGAASGSNANYYRSWTNFSVTPAASATTYDGKEYNEYTYRFELESATKKSRLYVLANDGTWAKVAEDATQQSGDLYLVLGAIAEKASSESIIFSDVKIYKGLTASKTYTNVEIIDGQEKEVITVEGTEYELPSEKKAGYMFQGWKVNGAETITKVGEKISTVNLKTLEKVFVPVMSEIWWQSAKIYDGETDTGKRDVRFVSAIDSLNYKSIGYDVTITYGGNSYDNNNFDLKHVYSSLLASYGSEVVTLETLGYDDTNGGYITAFVIKNVPNNVGDIKVELTPYQVTPDGTTVSGDKITVTLTAEKLNK